MTHADNKGFSLVEGLLLVLVLVITIGVGYYVYDRDSDNQSTDSSNNSSQKVINDDSNANASQKVPEGWVEYTEPDFNYAAPPSWVNISITRYALEDKVPYDYGSPVKYAYDSSSQKFVSVTPTYDGDTYTGDVEDSLVNDSDGRFGNVDGAEATAVFTTGDGGCGQHIVAFVHKGQIYDVRLERFCEPNAYLAMQLTEQEVESDIEAFIKSIILL